MTIMNNETITLQDLSIGYRIKNRDTRVVASAISACVKRGELTCLLGANGVGKSTLLRTLSAFQPKLGGSIFIKAEDGKAVREISEFTDKELSHVIGVVLTEKPDIRNMSVRELVALGRSPYTGFWGTLHDDDWDIVDEAIEAVRIGNLANRMIHTLSDGERQKVMIAKALAQQTPVIYLDEPTAFLDFPSKVEMMLLLRRLARENDKTIFLSTHDFELALQVADTLWLMEKHGDEQPALHIGTPQQLASNGALARYVERPGITFDPKNLSVTVAK